MVLDADMNHHKYIFVDEVGFNLAKTRHRGQNIIDQRANVQVPGQRGGNISMCAATSENGVIGRRPLLGSYNAAHLIEFLKEIELACQGEGVTYVIVWDNVRGCSSMVSGPSPIHDPLPAFIFSFPQPYWGFFSQPIPWACHPPSGHGWGMWWHQCSPMSSMDSPCQKFFSEVHEQWWHSLWCGRESMAKWSRQAWSKLM